MVRQRSLMARFALALALAGSPGAARASELLVHAAASLTDVMGELGAAYAARTGTRVLVNAAGSNALARQIVGGAPGDVFVSADAARMDQVEKAGLVAAGMRRDLLTNSLVVVVPAGSPFTIASCADLAAPAIRSVALADPAAVPAGIHAREHLERSGDWERVKGMVVPSENVRAALAAVASGNVDAGIVYATDAATTDGVRVALRIPADPAHPIRYPAAALTTARDPALARAFLAFLRSEEARAVLGKHGFGIAVAD